MGGTASFPWYAVTQQFAYAVQRFALRTGPLRERLASTVRTSGIAQYTERPIHRSCIRKHLRQLRL